MFRHLTYANIVATVALILALGGGAAFAANRLGEGSVGTRALKPGAVTAAKLHKDSVTSPKIKDHSIARSDLGFKLPVQAILGQNTINATALQGGAVTGVKIAENAVTSTKIADAAVTGQKLASGSVGGSKLAAIQEVTQTVPKVGSGEAVTLAVECPVGSVLLGGGGGFVIASPEASKEVHLSRSIQRAASQTWEAAGFNGSAEPVAFQVEAHCLSS